MPRFGSLFEFIRQKRDKKLIKPIVPEPKICEICNNKLLVCIKYSCIEHVLHFICEVCDRNFILYKTKKCEICNNTKFNNLTVITEIICDFCVEPTHSSLITQCFKNHLACNNCVKTCHVCNTIYCKSCIMCPNCDTSIKTCENCNYNYNIKHLSCPKCTLHAKNKENIKLLNPRKL